MRFVVHGTPIPQGSLKAFAVRKGGRPTGRVVVTADNLHTKSWRQQVTDAAVAELAEHWGMEWAATNAHPMGVSLAFRLPRPQSHYGTGRNASLVRPGAPSRPSRKPDVDKLTRAVLDALTDAQVFRDDAQVCSLLVDKSFPRDRERPGVTIEVVTLPC